jgi:ribosomal protein S21
MHKNNKTLKLTLPSHYLGAKVIKTKRNPYGDITSAIQHWKKNIKDSDVLQTLKDKKEFIKPSVIKRKQLNRAKYINKLQELDRY